MSATQAEIEKGRRERFEKARARQVLRAAPGYVPTEVLDLVRFMAKTWAEVDKFVYENCTGDALMKYPVIQGTRNQMDLTKIGEQPINKENLHKAVQWMLST